MAIAYNGKAYATNDAQKSTAKRTNIVQQVVKNQLGNVRNVMPTPTNNATTQRAAQAISSVPKNAPYSSDAARQRDIDAAYLGYLATGAPSGGGGTNTGGGSGGGYVEASGWGGGGGGGFDLSSYLASLRAEADAAFNRARSSLDSTLTSTLGGLLESYEARKKALQGQYDNSKQTLDSDNESALRQAYINKMINARDMAQLLTAQGLTGGASETTTANMLNNYANNRNSLNRTYATNLRDLLSNHESLLADALGAYNDKVANARQSYSNYLAQLEQNRANMIASAVPSFSNLLNLLG